MEMKRNRFFWVLRIGGHQMFLLKEDLRKLWQLVNEAMGITVTAESSLLHIETDSVETLDYVDRMVVGEVLNIRLSAVNRKALAVRLNYRKKKFGRYYMMKTKKALDIIEVIRIT